jgi:uncharacterized membrane protein YjgN (DUF898 family)
LAAAGPRDRSGLAALAAILGVAASAVLSDAASLTSDVFMVGFGCLLAAGALALHVYVAARLENYAWSCTRIGDDRFRLDLQVKSLYRIYLANVIVIALYKLSRLCLQATADLDRHLAEQREQMAAVGQELGDALDLDLGL